MASFIELSFLMVSRSRMIEMIICERFYIKEIIDDFYLQCLVYVYFIFMIEPSFVCRQYTELIQKELYPHERDTCISPTNFPMNFLGCTVA